jgi:hypothetical protein
MELLFNNVQQIYELHKGFVLGFSGLLKNALATGELLNPTNIVLLMFDKEEKIRDLYRRYARSYPESIATLLRCIKSSIVRDFFLSCKKNANDKDLNYLLSLPLDRICSYDLIFDVSIPMYFNFYFLKIN